MKWNLEECLPDNSKSVIYRLKAGFDTEIGHMRYSVTTGFEIVKELGKGKQYEMEIKTDKSPVPRRIRFTHI